MSTYDIISKEVKVQLLNADIPISVTFLGIISDPVN